MECKGDSQLVESRLEIPLKLKPQLFDASQDQRANPSPELACAHAWICYRLSGISRHIFGVKVAVRSVKQRLVLICSRKIRKETAD